MKFNNNYQLIGESISIGENVKIGDRTIIYDNVKICDNTIIANDCVIGEPINDYYSSEIYQNPPTIIGENSLIRSHAIIYAGSTFGRELQTGHRVTIRENSIFGRNCSIGTLCDLQDHVEIGDYCRLHSGVHMGQKTVLRNFVFVYASVIFTNDPTPPSNTFTGVTVNDFSQICAGALLMPGITIGKNCLVGAGSVPSKDFDDFSLIMGNPARRVGDVRDMKSDKDGGSPYPWMHHFDRGMPWKEIGYDEWLKIKNE